MSLPLRLAVRLRARLLRLYPRRFQAKFGEEMRAVFAEALAEAAAHEPQLLLVVYVRELCGLLTGLFESIGWLQLAGRLT